MPVLRSAAAAAAAAGLLGAAAACGAVPAPAPAPRAPALTSPAAVTFTVGRPARFTIAASTARAALAASGALPAGLRLGPARRGELTLAGTPAAGAGGQYGIALTARDAAGSGAQLLTVTVDQAPQFTSHPAISASTAAASSTAVTITGYPAAIITGAGALPAGMVLAALPGGTAVIYGTPRITGPGETRQITLTAVNAAGTAHETISLSVSNPAYVPPAPPVMMPPAPVMSAPPVMMPPG
jgi:hypothetical protein